ncbi:Uncharacterised protein [Burkholderia pseudomallei]|nr:Uncharacterised protein [Burkholderia pseudomallei]CAJ4838073.1 Uncharacterised protein [Burkholderia pseudomallei]CAJ9259213.1 Uncharacterised protein [Burkholderia pseudomallei]
MSQQQAPHAARGQGACPSPLDASPAVVGATLDSAPLPARSLGRGLRPHPAARCWGTFWRLGSPAPDGSPQQSADPPGGRCAGLGGGLDALAPRHALRSRCGSSTSTHFRALTARLWLACHARHMPCIGRGLWPRRRLRRHGGATADLPDCPAQARATLRQPARHTRPSALRAYSPGPLQGCGFRARPCVSGFSAGVGVRPGRNTQEERRHKQHATPHAEAGNRQSGLDI